MRPELVTPPPPMPAAIAPAPRPGFPWLLAAALVAGIVATVGLQPGAIVAQSARVVAPRTAVVPTVSGRVAAVAVAPGDRVTAGQPIARLDDTLARAHWRLAVARRARARGDEQAIAEAELAIARLALAEQVLRAPRAGTLADCTVEPGDYAAAGTPIATIQDARAPWVTASVAEHDAAAVHLGAIAHIGLPAFPGRTWPGHVSRIEALAPPHANRSGFARPVQITLDGLVPDAPPGAAATVRIER